MTPPDTSPALPSFDELVLLAQQDSQAFVQLKQNLCNALIEASSSAMQERLRAQQSHIDRVLSQCKNPTHANVILMRELRLQMVRFRDVLEGEVDNSTPADIIPFRPRPTQWR
ncbi:DUF3135 domain-containing protein [Vibrio sp. V27_P1S3P104]|uniref:DUF3135 domain-containing protein n=1 Tax=Vibrio TaxID=662 RepID=UPI000C16C1B4|nr:MULTISPECIES: DUF3135 domain-containing protein [Vibrio]NAW70737.1 DUF3135 domain-containing protein [Vibrio sp. V28_P6S34P95]NAX05929.1 DUF3135 domain-containing protein [Vibrio sp. V30_P3S12P165]NAX35604.1 DUF3135 domain-containing protein [Vibrio sp. V29_P1S30P107]NAX37750.1 DUF3135 domain-containing protein [Vibrio sp. V27_P1S3P104]NAX41010.1 DUF3135 domain-containing protein [Vibrio sp. V26_P1S5P106]